MNIYRYLICTCFGLVCFSCLSLKAQQAVLSGYAAGPEGSLPFARVWLEPGNQGTLTDSTGYFEFSGLEPGSYKLRLSALGISPLSRTVELQAGARLHLDTLKAEEALLDMETVVITGTMKETYISASPVKVEVMSGRYLERTLAPTSLVEGIKLINGVQEVVACGVCFTNSISINGLPGPYTAVLMDGSPIYGNLSAVYGLNGIPVQMIERFEVIKGPNSTLYGSEAMAGVINIITKDPEKQPILSLDVMGTSQRESYGNVAIAPKIGKLSGYAGLNWAYLNNFQDNNSDGFADYISMDRISGFTKWTLDQRHNKEFTLSGKYYYEDRRNGVEDYLKDRAYRELRGNDSIYGESIYTNRVEVFGRWELPIKENIRLDYSFNHHDQDSYYGSDGYQAKQNVLFGNLVWDRTFGRHALTTGLTGRWQQYDDNTIATETITQDGQSLNQPENQIIPGIFVQDEWTATDQLTILGGARLDHYQAHGPIFSPRLALKYKPGTWSTIRANFGTGFRVVNLFTEDHAFITGQREVVITEALNPERSFSGSLNFNQIYSLWGQGTFDVDAFYTYFTNKILPDYDDPTKIIYANSDGHALTMGLSMSVQHQFEFPLAFNVGLNFQRVRTVEPDDQGVLQDLPVEFAPEWSGVATVNYKWRKPNLTFAYTLNLTGHMALPEVYDLDANGNPLSEPRPTRSTPFAFQNLQVTKDFPQAKLSCYLGVQNLFNYIQSYSPLVGFNDPNNAAGFSPWFDTAYAYGTLQGRALYVGVRWNLARPAAAASR